MAALDERKYFYELTPEKILSAVEKTEFKCTGRILTLNSMENRVYEVEIDVPNEDELKSMVEHVCGMLKKLGLVHHQMLMATHDLSAPNAKKIDLEVWAAGQKRWLEVSSCSIFTDYQARRANIRYRDEEGKLHFVHTLNGSGLAVPRVLVGLMENNLQDDGTMLVPEVLRKWVGKDRIGTPKA